MASKAGEYLKYDQLKLRFTQANGQNGSPKGIIRRMANLTVAELIQSSYMASTNNLLYYELLDVSIIELETKKSLRINWVGSFNKEESQHAFLLPKNTTMNEVATEWLRSKVKLLEGGSGQIRIFEVMNGRVQRAFGGQELVREVHESVELYAEVSPPFSSHRSFLSFFFFF